MKVSGFVVHPPDMDVPKPFNVRLTAGARRVNCDLVSLGQPKRQLPVHDRHRTALLLGRDDGVVRLVDDGDLQKRACLDHVGGCGVISEGPGWKGHRTGHGHTPASWWSCFSF